jgi:hypothetical protein
LDSKLKKGSRVQGFKGSRGTDRYPEILEPLFLIFG